jgi:hypothetical protein
MTLVGLCRPEPCNASKNLLEFTDEHLLEWQPTRKRLRVQPHYRQQYLDGQDFRKMQYR